MTEQEAINDLKMSLRMWGRKPQKESYEMAIQALKKQMPKKPYFREEEGAKGYACPSCDMGVEIRLFQGGCVKERFCSCCGQALDWSSENENTAEN